MRKRLDQIAGRPVLSATRQRKWANRLGSAARMAMVAVVAMGCWRLVCADSVPQAAPGWSRQFGPVGLPFEVTCFAASGGKVYAAGGNEFLNLSVWDGQAWSRLLNDGIKRGRGIRAMIVYHDTLIVAGAFDSIGGIRASNVAMYSEGAWLPFHGGVGSIGEEAVTALAVFRGDLIVAGLFERVGASVPARNIACWDGTQWHALDHGVGGGWDGIPRALSIYRDRLYAGGRFDSAGAVLANGIASWDGSSWASLGAGVSGSTGEEGVFALAPIANVLMVGGAFDRAGNVSTSNLAIWNGAQWVSAGGDGTGANGPVSVLASDGERLVAAGSFGSIGGEEAQVIAQWSQGRWKTLGDTGELGISANAISLEAGARPIVGGDFYATSDGESRRFSHVAVLGDGKWRGMGNGVEFYVRDFVHFDGKVLACGTDLEKAGEWECDGRVMAWNGEWWEPFGPPVYAEELAVVDGTLYSLGSRFLRWNGADWGALAAPGNDLPGGSVSCVAGYKGELIAGGSFDVTIEGKRLKSIARWDGDSWEPLGSGVDGAVAVMLVHDGELFVSGDFIAAGSVSAEHVARWNGSDWAPAGLGLNASARRMIEWAGSLYATGGFTTTGGFGPALNRIARWNGSAWQALGSGLSGYGSDLVVHGSDLVVCGMFVHAGGVVVNGLARWNENGWSGYGQGLHLQGNPFSAESILSGPARPGSTAMSLYVGGFFDSIDGVESRGIARLDDYANVSVPANASSMTDLEMEIAPNPSASEQSLRFRLPSAARCRVFIMDLQGREVARLLDAWAPAGPQRMKWDGRTNAGGKAGAGVYWAVVRSGGVHASRQLIRIR